MSQSISLGKLQDQFEATVKAEKSAEGALKRAQEARDRARAKRVQAEQLLRDASRTVLG